MADERIDALTADGWIVVAAEDGSVAAAGAELTYTNNELPGHRILIEGTDDCWQHFDADGLLIGHSRYRTKLSDHLRDRHQPAREA